MLETPYRGKLVKKIERMFPGCVVMRPNPQARQGIPDLLILFGDTWAALEVKKSATAPYRPNQPWYVDVWNDMSFAAFIYPENEEDVLDALQLAFSARR